MPDDLPPINKFALVNMVVKRSHQLVAGAPPAILVRGDRKETATALAEIKAGRVKIKTQEKKA